MTIDLVFGIGAILLGVTMFVARIFGWDVLLSMRNRLQQRMGFRAGDVVHLLVYSGVPILCGLVILNRVFRIW